MDCHVHITDNDPYITTNRGLHTSYFMESSAFRALRGGYVAEQFLTSGFTTISIVWLLTSLGKWEILSTIIFIAVVCSIYFMTKKLKKEKRVLMPAENVF